MKSNKNALIIIPHLSVGGTEIQTLNTVKALIKANYCVYVLCLYRSLASVVKKFTDAGANVILSSPHYNNPDVAIQYQRNFRLIKFIYNELHNILKQRHYDVVHVQYMTPASTIIFILHYIFRHKNIIATAHTSGDIYKNLTIPRFITQHCLKAFQCITLRAEMAFFGSSQLFSPNLKLKKFGNHFTIYNCLPTHIAITDCSQRKRNTTTIGVVSRLEHIKGMDLVIPAFAMVAKEHPHCRLLVVGDGSLRTVMEQQALEEGVADRIEFFGRQGADTIQSYYDRIDILLMPSRSEGFGLTAIEGMARGCVPVVANVGGLPEVVIDGKCGLLHRPEDPVDMASKILTLIVNTNLIYAIRQNLYKRANYFNIDKYFTSITQLYSLLKIS